MNKERARAAIYGTLVADAAAMGLHWIYSQGKISSLLKKQGLNPEFLEPDEANYQGVPSFFAHPHTTAGDGSNYSSWIHLLFKAMKDGKFTTGNYIRAFSEYYGVGGGYVGYADGPMRETIFNITIVSKSLIKKVTAQPSTLSDDKKDMAAIYIARYFFDYEKDGLKNAVKNILKLSEFSREELAATDLLVDAVSGSDLKTGADDDQMPGLTRSALFAWLYKDSELDQELEKAVRITNDNDLCVAHALFMARILSDFYNDSVQSDGIRASVLKHLTMLPQSSQDLIHQAMNYDSLDYQTATKTFGAACHVEMAVPLSIHILLNTKSFTEAVRTNILASGDNCGRSIFLGALAGAMYGIGGERGIPEAWLKRTHLIPVIDSYSVL